MKGARKAIQYCSTKSKNEFYMKILKSVRKRLKMGDKKERTRVFQGLRKRTETLTQTKADTWSHMYTNAQQLEETR